VTENVADDAFNTCIVLYCIERVSVIDKHVADDADVTGASVITSGLSRSQMLSL